MGVNPDGKSTARCKIIVNARPILHGFVFFEAPEKNEKRTARQKLCLFIDCSIMACSVFFLLSYHIDCIPAPVVLARAHELSYFCCLHSPRAADNVSSSLTSEDTMFLLR